MAIRVNRSLVTSAADLQISSNSEKLQQVDFISFTTKSDEPVGIVIYSTTNDTSSFPNEKINLHQFSITSKTPKILLKEDFPIGDANEYLFGNDSSYNKLFVAVSSSEDVSDRVIVHYSVTDVSVSADYTTEMIQDIVGAMFTGNTETNIAATYEDSDGTIDLASVDTNTTYSAFDNDNAGLVPDPGSTGTTTKYLREDGSFQVPPDTNTTYSEATSSAEGLMSTAHHDKLDGIAAGAEVNVQSDWNSASGDNQILNKPALVNPASVTVFPSSVATGNILWKQAKVTLSEAQLNSLHSTPITLVAAQGADTIIMCGDAISLIDRDSSTAQSASTCDLIIGYNSTTTYTEAILYERRFMYNESGDRTWSLKADYSGEVASSLTGAVNVPVTIAFTNACTSGSLDSVTIYLQYYVIDNS
tara:strand:+ start:17265 stop:18515 length:1251 start_codon:yes stop_codon:yes gene_type:complete